MIPRRYITGWKKFAPWLNDSQVEQDLIIERALVQLFSDPFLKNQLAFRGGTALHKILCPGGKQNGQLKKTGPNKLKPFLTFLFPEKNILVLGRTY